MCISVIEIKSNKVYINKGKYNVELCDIFYNEALIIILIFMKDYFLYNFNLYGINTRHSIWDQNINI